MRKKIFFAGSILVLMLILGSSVAFAASPSGTTSAHAHPTAEFVDQVAAQLHLTADQVAQIQSQIASGTSIRDVLANNGITTGQVRAALAAVLQAHHLSNTRIQSLATSLGLDPTEVQSEIDSGKSLGDILKAHNITHEQVVAALHKYVPEN